MARSMQADGALIPRRAGCNWESDVTLEDAIVSAVKECNRNGVRATATTVLPRLPETMAYSRDWIKVVMSNMAMRGQLEKIGKKKGYAPSGYCRCCGAPLSHHVFAN